MMALNSSIIVKNLTIIVLRFAKWIFEVHLCSPCYRKIAIGANQKKRVK